MMKYIKLLIIFITGLFTSCGYKAVDTSNIQPWPDGVVPYSLDAPEGIEVLIMDIIYEIEANSPVMFYRSWKDTDDSLHIEVWDRPYSQSNIGYNPGNNVISLNVNAPRWVIMHEMLHALGMRHEHTRKDRDSHIIVNWDNIDPDAYKDFEISTDHLYDITEYSYDIYSIMHYHSKNWAISGRSIETINSYFIHNPGAVTKLDWLKLNAIYNK